MYTKTAVILCGGKGTRLYGNGALQSKPLTRIGDKPIISHLIDYMVCQGFDDFILLCGYLIQDYRKWYAQENGYYNSKGVTITILDTGVDTPTGERILMAKDKIKNAFVLTYGDGLADIDFADMSKYIQKSDFPHMVITVVHPPSRFGVVSLIEKIDSTHDYFRSNVVTKFNEKPNREDWINGGFIFCSPVVLDFLEVGDTFERETINRFMDEFDVYAYKHTGNWECLDTPKDLELLENLWESNRAFWSNREKHCDEGRPC